MNDLADDISRHVWQTKYRYCGRAGGEHAIDDTWRRIARALAAVEGPNAATWEKRFLTILRDFRFLPGGRIPLRQFSGKAQADNTGVLVG